MTGIVEANRICAREMRKRAVMRIRLAQHQARNDPEYLAKVAAYERAVEAVRLQGPTGPGPITIN